MIDNIMNEAIESDDYDKIMSMFNSGVVPVRVLLLSGSYETRWVDVSKVNKTYYEDLSSDQQDYLLEGSKSSYLDTIYNHDKMVEKFELENNIHISQMLNGLIEDQFVNYEQYKKYYG
jgi:hypothetical protein|tara:strand:- start:119 stop:472 length:354 start_codon:yes stop_codon:yes gene_type:complete